jgi:uncharacterized protein YndB with AHSA1/START domain
MSDHGEILGAGTVRFERLLPGPIDNVWAHLTEPGKRALWLAGGEMDLRPGGRVELVFRHGDLSPLKEPVPAKYGAYEGESIMHGRIIRCEPPRLLSYTWGEDFGEDSEVAFELIERGAEVLLVLTHRRLEGRDVHVSVLGGWHVHLQILTDRLHGREPRPFWSAHVAVEPEYERRVDRTLEGSRDLALLGEEGR